MGDLLSNIYEAVKATGLPNVCQARHLLPTNLNIPFWAKNLEDNERDRELLDMIVYGFLLGYVGPTSNVQDVGNHPSAVNFPTHIESFIHKEIQLGGSSGAYGSSTLY